MKSLIIGTTNPAKISQLRGALASLNLQISGLPIDIQLPSVVEDGKTAQDNARKKALSYSTFLNEIVLSMDNALYIDGLTDDQQPGLNVRRIPNLATRPSDDDLVSYYSGLLAKLDSPINGHWEFAICIASPNGATHETTVISPRIFTSNLTKNVIVGYPLESLQIDPDSNKYIADMNQEEKDAFWEKQIGKQLCDFVAKTLKNLQ